jgi:hypothetical protein
MRLLVLLGIVSLGTCWCSFSLRYDGALYVFDVMAASAATGELCSQVRVADVQR